MPKYKSVVVLTVECEGYSEEQLNHKWAEVMRTGMKLFGPGFREDVVPQWEKQDIVEKVSAKDKLEF